MKAKYSNALVELFREVFCWLPLVHVLNGKVMVVHGGLFSQEGVTLDDIRAIDRNMCESFLMELFHHAVPPTPSSDPSCKVSVQSGSAKSAAARQTSSPRHWQGMPTPADGNSDGVPAAVPAPKSRDDGPVSNAGSRRARA